MAEKKITTSIDYTSRDFFSIREDLITRIKNRVDANGKVWNGSDPADFGVAIVEAFAHVGDLTNYYIDRAANESYIGTATQRQTLLNLASMYGYQVSGWRQAYVDVTISNSGATSLVVPANTLFSVTITVTTNGSSTTYQEYYTLQDDVTVGGGGTAAGVLIHGRNVSAIDSNAADVSDPYDIPGERLGYSDGFSNQSYRLKYNQVAEGTVEVFVRNGNSFDKWSEVTNLSEYGPQEFVYTITYDGDNYAYINFGDGVSGSIPVFGDDIKAQYYVGGGLIGNIEGGKSFSIVSVPLSSGVLKADLTPISVSNSESGYGGEDPESNDSIRLNAPAALRSSQRAVSLDDFKSLALSVAGVGKAAAYASAPTSINVYVGPSVSDTSNDYFPGFAANGTTLKTSWTDLQSIVSSEFGGRTQIGTTVTILPPAYVPADVVVEYVAETGYSDSQIITALNAGVVFDYGYNYLDFNQNIRPEKLEQSLSSIDGVDSVKVVELYRNGASAARTTLVPAAGEYFVFKDVNTKIYPICSLRNLVVTIGNGTMPTFNALVKTYAFTSTSSTMTFTPTSVNTASTLTYTFTNGSGTVTGPTSITSGVASSSLTLTTGLNTIAVTSTSSDSLNTNTYYIKVTK
jgi:hypothetical protein